MLLVFFAFVSIAVLLALLVTLYMLPAILRIEPTSAPGCVAVASIFAAALVTYAWAGSSAKAGCGKAKVSETINANATSIRVANLVVICTESPRDFQADEGRAFRFIP
ncbi:MAG: hypothetical protein IJI68_10420 [Eggerthellaceae bacterium]|nr:hypothetical protein [Eggerthellaceae bacterium]